MTSACRGDHRVERKHTGGKRETTTPSRRGLVRGTVPEAGTFACRRSEGSPRRQASMDRLRAQTFLCVPEEYLRPRIEGRCQPSCAVVGRLPSEAASLSATRESESRGGSDKEPSGAFFRRRDCRNECDDSRDGEKMLKRGSSRGSKSTLVSSWAWNMCAQPTSLRTWKEKNRHTLTAGTS